MTMTEKPTDESCPKNFWGHEIHPWGKWTDTTMTQWNPSVGKEIRASWQIRTCKRCGLRETKPL